MEKRYSVSGVPISGETKEFSKADLVAWEYCQRWDRPVTVFEKAGRNPPFPVAIWERSA